MLKPSFKILTSAVFVQNLYKVCFFLSCACRKQINSRCKHPWRVLGEDFDVDKSADKNCLVQSSMLGQWMGCGSIIFHLWKSLGSEKGLANWQYIPNWVHNNNNNNNQHLDTPAVRNRIWGAVVTRGLWGGKEMSFYVFSLFYQRLDGLWTDEYSVGLNSRLLEQSSWMLSGQWQCWCRVQKAVTCP